MRHERLIDEHERQVELVDLHRHHEKEREGEEPPPTLRPSANRNDLSGALLSPHLNCLLGRRCCLHRTSPRYVFFFVVQNAPSSPSVEASERDWKAPLLETEARSVARGRAACEIGPPLVWRAFRNAIIGGLENFRTAADLSRSRERLHAAGADGRASARGGQKRDQPFRCFDRAGAGHDGG